MEEVSEEDDLDENRNKVGPPSSEIGWGVGASPHVNQVSANSAGDRVTTGADTLTVEGGGDVCYYSDTEDSTIMMSGNSPFISKAARCNFLSRSGKPSFSLIKIAVISGFSFRHFEKKTQREYNSKLRQRLNFW